MKSTDVLDKRKFIAPIDMFTCVHQLKSNPLYSCACVNTKLNLGVDHANKNFFFIYFKIKGACTKIYVCQCIN